MCDFKFFYLKILLDREKSDRASLENQLKEKTKDLQQAQALFDQERALLNAK